MDLDPVRGPRASPFRIREVRSLGFKWGPSTIHCNTKGEKPLWFSFAAFAERRVLRSCGRSVKADGTESKTRPCSLNKGGVVEKRRLESRIMLRSIHFPIRLILWLSWSSRRGSPSTGCQPNRCQGAHTKTKKTLTLPIARRDNFRVFNGPATHVLGNAGGKTGGVLRVNPRPPHGEAHVSANQSVAQIVSHFSTKEDGRNLLRKTRTCLPRIVARVS